MARKETFLVDRSKLFREGMKTFLAESPFPAMNEAAELREAAALIKEGLIPDIIILDFMEGSPQDLEAIREIRQLCPDAKIVLLANDVSARKLTQALDTGIDACLVKNITSDALIKYLGLVVAGERVFPVELARLLIDGKLDGGRRISGTSYNGLSQREVEILGCLVNGDPNKVIANRLKITEATVKVHLKGLLRKINVANRTQAAMWAVNNGVDRHCAFDH
ncbi:MAG: response regulator transcription factor [Rhodospirillales bacterium]|jgi:two-component system nitrate/nitrite response regulator NarL|nr:response regulator transcription factor [Rhodospirillales bacterium]